MATTFPATLDTAVTLYDAVNNATSTLSGSHTAGGTTIDLVSAALFPSTGGIIYVGNERTTYTGKTSNQLTGMAVLSNNYAAGIAVAMYVDAEHHNTLRGAAVAIETLLGATGSVVAGTVTKRLADLEAASSTVESQIVAAAAKVTPVDADSFGIVDSAAANSLKELTWANMKATLLNTEMTWTAIQTLLSPKEVRTAPTISAGVLTLNLALSNVFDVSLNAAITTLTISNPAASGTSHGFILTFTADGTARAVTWPAAVLWPAATAPTLTSTNAKKDKFVFHTTDGGTTYHAFVAGQNL